MSGNTELVFLLDASDHATAYDFDQLRVWLMMLVEAFDLRDDKLVSIKHEKFNKVCITVKLFFRDVESEPSSLSTNESSKTRLGLVLFSDRVEIALDLLSFASRQEVWREIADMEPLGKNTVH